MKVPLRLPTVLLLVSTVLTIEQLSATTCVQIKPFKVNQLCGLVVDRDNVPIPGATIQLVDLRTDLPDVVDTVRSDAQGNFKFADASPGEYAIRAKFSGFATANQNLLVRKSKPETACRKPISVKLQLAGECSSVSIGR
jgi:hypothetical protein